MKKSQIFLAVVELSERLQNLEMAMHEFLINNEQLYVEQQKQIKSIAEGATNCMQKIINLEKQVKKPETITSIKNIRKWKTFFKNRL